MDEFVCPWCGEDLLPLFASMKPCSYDAVYEAHAEGCDVMQREMGLTETTNNSLPCEGDN